MRLIDADAFKEEMGTETKIRRMVCSAIDEQPTVFDLDKVVAELEEKQQKWKTKLSESDTNYMDNAILKQYISHYDKAIDIVKNGGI